VMDRIRLGCLIGLLLFSTVELRWIAHGHAVPPRSDFDTFPTQLDDWSGQNLPDLDATVTKVLAADNYLLRNYHNSSSGADMGLFIAYYGSQRSGDALHSPKNCLPGAGWEPVTSGTIRIADPSVPGSSFVVNHYVIEKGGVQQDVLYWYQAHGRRFASEYLGKIYLAWDGITKGRTDGALIRITASRTSGGSQSLPAMVAFAKDLSPVLPQYLPN
jgi:EpsI family protein